MSVGKRLRAARERAGLTQTMVSRLTGIGNKSISNYENDVSSPDVEILRVLCKLYGVSADEIIDVPGVNIVSDFEGQEVDPDVRMIARAMNGMPAVEREKLKKIIQITFDKYFPEGGDGSGKKD